jgi:3-oxoacyl-[acyl-carrier-protein] synthase-3
LAWAHAIEDGRVKPGDVLVIEALGGGLTYGAVTVRM